MACIECGAPDDDPDVAIVSWPSGACEERIELDASMFHFEALDTDPNLYCTQARFYDPEQGRWLSQFPMGFDAGDSNLFRYPHQPDQDH
jgi:RHS repeat-associated protein